MRWVPLCILCLTSVSAWSVGASPVAATTAHKLESYSLQESCEILDTIDFASPTGLQTLSLLEGPGYAVRVVAKPNTRSASHYDVAILVGELHMKPCVDAERALEFLKEFRHFAFELYMAPPHEAGKPLPPGFGPGGSSFAEAQATYGLCGSIITEAAQEVVFRSGGQKKLYYLEGPDFAHPLTWKERLAMMPEEALMRSAFWLAQTFHLKPGNSEEPETYRQEIAWQSARVPASVAQAEAYQKQMIERYGKIQPQMGGVDIRNKVMAQNIGVILSKRDEVAEPVVALMGSGHITGVKHQLMLYQKFKEIPLAHLRSCARGLH